MTTDQILTNMYLETKISLIRIMRAGHKVFPCMCLFKVDVPPTHVEKFKESVQLELIRQDIGWSR